MKRYQQFEDLFTVTCKQCGSKSVDVSGDFEEDIGSVIYAICNNCGSSYDYLNFIYEDYED